MAFSGHVYYGTGKKLVRNKELNLIIQSPKSGTRMLTVQVDSSGRFSIDNLQFSDSVSVYFQVNEDGDKAKNIRLQLDGPAAPPGLSVVNLASVSQPMTTLDSVFQVWASKKADMDSAIRRYVNAKELKQIFIQGKSKDRALLQEMDDRYTFGLFSNTDGFSYDLVHHPEYLTELDVFNFLADRVPSLRLKGSFPHDTLQYRGDGVPALYLNELPATPEEVNNIPLSWIAYVKFIYPPFMGAYMGGPSGAVAVYLKKGDDLFANSYGLNRVTLQGYDSPRQFYAPLYDDVPNMLPTSSQDYRLTLTWQPIVTVNDSTRDATIQFYNNDHSHRFRIVAEGMDLSGRLLHFEQDVDAPISYSKSVAKGQ